MNLVASLEKFYRIAESYEVKGFQNQNKKEEKEKRCLRPNF